MTMNVYIINTKVVVASLIYMFSVDKFFILSILVSQLFIKLTYFEMYFFELFKQSWLKTHHI
jgi:hypothetical protein